MAFSAGAGWAGLYVVVTCLYASAFAAWALFGNQTDKKAHMIQAEVSQTHPVRDNLLYFAVGVAVVMLVMAVAIHDDVRGVHRSFKKDWFVGVGSACVALGYAAKAFWMSRGNWRLWAIIAALFVLYAAITIPVLSQMENVPLLLMGPLTNVELPLAILLLGWLVPNRSGNR